MRVTISDENGVVLGQFNMTSEQLYETALAINGEMRGEKRKMDLLAPIFEELKKIDRDIQNIEFNQPPARERR